MEGIVTLTDAEALTEIGGIEGDGRPPLVETVVPVVADVVKLPEPFVDDPLAEPLVDDALPTGLRVLESVGMLIDGVEMEGMRDRAGLSGVPQFELPFVQFCGMPGVIEPEPLGIQPGP